MSCKTEYVRNLNPLALVKFLRENIGESYHFLPENATIDDECCTIPSTYDLSACFTDYDCHIFVNNNDITFTFPNLNVNFQKMMVEKYGTDPNFTQNLMELFFEKRRFEEEKHERRLAAIDEQEIAIFGAPIRDILNGEPFGK
jgi:hypothetical protein